MNTILPYRLTDGNGYPTDEFLDFIRSYNYDTMPILDFVEILCSAWKFSSFKLKRKYDGKRKLELHTAGWSGNEDIICAVQGNVFLTNAQMRLIKWETGGHYYFYIYC